MAEYIDKQGGIYVHDCFMYTIVLDNEKNILLSAAECKQHGNLYVFFNEQRKIVAEFNINNIVGFYRWN